MSGRKLSTEGQFRSSQPQSPHLRATHRPSPVDLNQEVVDWRRRTQNINPARNSHKQSTQRISPYAPCIPPQPIEGRRTESIYSPKAASRGDSNIKINLNFESRAYELESDVAELQRQLRLKDRNHQLMLQEFEESKIMLERKVEILSRKDSNQSEHITQLQMVVRELKSRLMSRNTHHSPAMRFGDGEVPQRFPTEGGNRKLESSALTCDRSNSKLAASSLKRSTFGDSDPVKEPFKEQLSEQPTAISFHQQRYSQVRQVSGTHQAGELQLKSAITPVSDKNIQIKIATDEQTEMGILNERLEREVKDLAATITALTRSNDELKQRLKISQANNLKISDLKEEIDKFAQQLLDKEAESEILREQIKEMQVESQTMREVMAEQQQKLARTEELAVALDTLTRENNNLKKESAEIETHYEQILQEVEDLRLIKEEASQLKSNNLELVVQSANEVESMIKLMAICQAIQKGIERMVAPSLKENSPQPSPAKSFTQETEAVAQDSLRMQESFVTDGLRNHETHLQIVKELEETLTKILDNSRALEQRQATTVQAQTKRTAEVEELRTEVEEMSKELEQERSLTNSLLLETKEMRKTIELLHSSTQEKDEACHKAEPRRSKKKCKTVMIMDTHDSHHLSSIEEHPEEERQTDHEAQSVTIPSSANVKTTPEQQALTPKSQSEGQQQKDRQQSPRRSIQPANRTSLLFDRVNLANEATVSSQYLPSRTNLKCMSFKELSYTLLTEFCDKNDQRTLFINLMEETVCRYFQLESSSLGRSVLEFLNSMYTFPNHALLIESASKLLQELKDFSISAKREVASLEEAIESYVQSVTPVFTKDSDQYFEDETEEEESSHNQSCNRSHHQSLLVRSDINLSGMQDRATLRQQLQAKNDMSSVTELLEKGLNETISKLRRRSTLSRVSISSGSSGKAAP